MIKQSLRISCLDCKMSLPLFINEHWVYKESATLPMVIYEYREYLGHPTPVNHDYIRELLLAKGYTIGPGNKVVPVLKKT